MATDDDGKKIPRARLAEPPTVGVTPVGDATLGPDDDHVSGTNPPDPGTLHEGPPEEFKRWQRFIEGAAPEVAEAFEIVGTFGQPGGQADLFLCRPKNATGGRVVVKFYRAKAPVGDDPRERFRLLDQKFVAPYLDPGFGIHEGRWWEVTEYFPHGNLRQFAQSQKESVLSPDQVKATVKKLSAALSHFHSQVPHVIHRDIKPANVLVRTVDPLDVVVCDFGSAVLTDASRAMLTAAERTPYYTAPEAIHAGARAPVAPSRDWWSLGMLIAEVATGRHPYQRDDGSWMEVWEIQSELGSNHPVPLVGIRSPRLLLLLRGLLTITPERRWGGDKVNEWLAGGSPAVFADPVASDTPLGAKARRAIPPPPGLGITATDPAEIAQYLAKNWRHAGDIVAGNYFPELVNWVQEYHPDHSLEAVARDRASRLHSVDRTIAEIIVRFDPSAQPTFMRVPVDVKSLYNLPKKFAADGVGDLADMIEKLFSSGALIAYARLEGHGDLTLIEAKWREWCGLADGWFQAVPEAGGMNSETRALILRAAIGEVIKPAAGGSKAGSS